MVAFSTSTVSAGPLTADIDNNILICHLIVANSVQCHMSTDAGLLNVLTHAGGTSAALFGLSLLSLSARLASRFPQMPQFSHVVTMNGHRWYHVGRKRHVRIIVMPLSPTPLAPHSQNGD